MNKEELEGLLHGYRIFRMQDKDCSEYAEDVISYINRGKIYSYSNPKPMRFFGIEQKFLYHTVVKVDNFIIDVTSDKILYTIEEFDNLMGCKGSDGYVSNFF